jgi:hypothetical protein
MLLGQSWRNLDINIHRDRQFGAPGQPKEPYNKLLANFQAISNRIRMKLLTQLNALTNLQ